MKTLKRAILLLTPIEQRKAMVVLLLVMGMAILETIGVASIMPLAVMGNPDMLNTNNLFLNKLYNASRNFGVNSPDEFLIALGLTAFVIIVFSSIYRSVTQYIMNRFIEMRRHSIGASARNIFKTTLLFFLDRNSNDMTKNVISEVDQLIGNVFRPALYMVSYIIVMITLATLLLIINPWIAMLAAGLMGLLYSVVFQTQKKLEDLGKIKDLSNKDRFMATGEVFGGVKDIKLHGFEENYIMRFQKPSKEFAYAHAIRETIQQVPNYLIEGVLFGAMLLLSVFIISTSGGLDSDSLGYILPILGLYALAALRFKACCRLDISRSCQSSIWPRCC